MGNFEEVTWRTPHRIVNFNISMKFLRVTEKEFYCGVPKISRFVIILTSKCYILVINRFRNGHITVIFHQYHTLISEGMV